MTDRNKAEENQGQYRSQNKDLQNLNSYDESRSRGALINRFEEEKQLEDEQGNHNESQRYQNEQNMGNLYDDNEDDMDDEEQKMLDQRVPQIVNQFFEQNSNQRFSYLQGLKQLLTRQLQKNFKDAKNSLLPEEAQFDEGDENEEEDDESDMLMNLPPQLIEMVLQFIFKIYSDEFEEKKNQCETESQKNNLKTEDVFDEYDRQAIDELTFFIRQYSQEKAQMMDQLNQIQTMINQNHDIDQLRQYQMNFQQDDQKSERQNQFEEMDADGQEQLLEELLQMQNGNADLDENLVAQLLQNGGSL